MYDDVLLRENSLEGIVSVDGVIQGGFLAVVEQVIPFEAAGSELSSQEYNRMGEDMVFK